MEKNCPSSGIGPRATSSLGGCFGAPSFQHSWLLLHCCWPYTQSSHFTVLPSLYECITLCAGEGLRTPMSLSLPSLAFCPKHKPLEARHGNAEISLWRKTVPCQGLSPEPPALSCISVLDYVLGKG